MSYNRIRPSTRHGGTSSASGFTLTEVMIALSITLLILLAMMQAFTVASKDISVGRNRLILAERIQSATDLIRADLERLSLGVEPIVSDVEDLGYFEYVDGAFRDMTFSQVPSNSTLGDFDDVLAFTVRSQGEPFKGRYMVGVDPDGTPGSGDEVFDSSTIESMEAEVIYYTYRTDPTIKPEQRFRDGGVVGNGEVDYGDSIRLYRRVLLVRPDLSNTSAIMDQCEVLFNQFVSTYAPNVSDRLANRSRYAKFLQYCDVSLRFDPIVGDFVPNSMGTLTHPKNRTAHDVANFPHPLLVNDPRDLDAGTPQALVAPQTFLSDLILLGTMAGNDVVMENVAAFDVKVFDPQADMYEYAGLPVTAEDPGFVTLRNNFIAGGGVVADRGSYVDLGTMEYRTTNFAPAPTTPAPFVPSTPVQTPVAVTGENYWFAYWDGDGQRDLSSSPAANYYNNLFLAYQTASGGPVYTTWPTSFENDGIDNDGDGLFDEGADGVPVGTPVPDLFSDADSAPPYAYPITSIKVTLRTASFDADQEKISASDQVVQSQIVVSTTNQ